MLEQYEHIGWIVKPYGTSGLELLGGTGSNNYRTGVVLVIGPGGLDEWSN